MKMSCIATLALLATLPACKRQDMYTQNYAKTWDAAPFFADQSSMRHPVAGTVARGAPLTEPAPPTIIDATLLERGRERFEIFCTPCHGRTGAGDGMIVRRGFPHPPSLVDGKLRAAPAGIFYDAITRGYGAMYSFSTRVAPADRWAIVAYIRALQMAQNTEATVLPPPDRALLEAAR